MPKHRDIPRAPSLEELEQLSVQLLELGYHMGDPAWLRQRSVDEVLALTNASVAVLSYFAPFLRAVELAAVFPVTDEERTRVQDLAKQAHAAAGPPTSGRHARRRRPRAPERSR